MVLSYRHGFHAGNWSDVLKHSLTSLSLLSLHAKNTPFYYLDTHTASALYNLRLDGFTQKKCEYVDGVQRVFTRKDAPLALQPYLSALRALNQAKPYQAQSNAFHLPYSYQSLLQFAKLKTTNLKSLPPIQSSNPSSAQISNMPLLCNFNQFYDEQDFEADQLVWYPGSSLLAAYFTRHSYMNNVHSTTNLNSFASQQIVFGREKLKPILDRMTLCELHPTEAQLLKEFYAPASVDGQTPPPPQEQDAHFHTYQHGHELLPDSLLSRISVQACDGFSSLTSRNVRQFLPPPQNRGLVLIDPPYELKDEMEKVVKAVKDGVSRWRNGSFAIWYPILDSDKFDLDEFKHQLHLTNIPKILCVELNMKDSVQASKLEQEKNARQTDLKAQTNVSSHKQGAQGTWVAHRKSLGMIGSGMIFVNPSYFLLQNITAVMDFLVDSLPLHGTKASYSIMWINPEHNEQKNN